MAHQSLYRKWRPQTFAAMVGQEHVARTLVNAVASGRAAHAYLFTGPRGTGKTSAARLFAKALNCMERDGGEPCDHCLSCVAIREGRSLDVLEIDGASNRGIEDIRELRDHVGMAPAMGPFRFYIIDEVHQLTEAAFNALLKTLEEPPAHVVFILATTDRHKVPATITSRCQHFSFHRIGPEGLERRLSEVAAAEGLTIAPDALAQLVQVADGSLRDGESILDQAVAFCGTTIEAEALARMLGLVPAAAVADFAEQLRQKDAAAAFRLLERLADEGADLHQFTRQLLVYLRGILTDQTRAAANRDGRWPTERLLVAIRTFAGIDFGARMSVAPQLPLELVTVELCMETPLPVARTDLVADVPVSHPAPQSARAGPAVSRDPAVGPITTSPLAPPARGTRAAERAPAVPPNGPAATEEPAVLRPSSAPAPAPFDRGTGVAPSVPADQRRAWDKLLSELRGASQHVRTVCNTSTFHGVQDGALLLATSNVFVIGELAKPSVRGMIEKMAAKVFGTPVTLRCITPEEAAGTRIAEHAEAPRDLAAEAAKDPTVKAAIEVFGARIDSVLPAEDGSAAG